MDKFSYIANAHGDYLEQLYQSYQQDPNLVDVSWQKFFEGFDFAQAYQAASPNGQPASKDAVAAPNLASQTNNLKEIAVRNLISGYRLRGHLQSKTNPVRPRRDRKALLELSDYNLSDQDLDSVFEAGNELGLGAVSLRKIVEVLKNIYEGTIGFEYGYISAPEARTWLMHKIEQDYIAFNPSIEFKKRILYKLNEAVVFENFLHTKYIGQKRFSLEGGETAIAGLDAIIEHGAKLGVETVVIGMAHRGRLNVLANIMGKTYEHIFNEFEGTATPDLTMGDGDVKYHMGYSSELETQSGAKVHVKLVPNPSHLEAVNPVVEGFSRAKADRVYNGETAKVLPLLIHGDAAVAGQGIVYEVAQMAGLMGYSTGGTIHFVINNQVGFTTDFADARTSVYCTDVAKVIEAPVLHVNGDDPEAVVFCVQLAVEYRQKFGKDIYIDMVCYRRYGHNESDEPKFTQPTLYNLIANHVNPREVYNQKLIQRGDIDAQIASQMDQEFRNLLQDRLNMVKQNSLPYTYQPMDKEWQELRRSTPTDFDSTFETKIDKATIELVGQAVCKIPADFKPIKQVEKLLKDRQDMFFGTGVLNWSAAELLAYGSLLLENKKVRLSGQDVQRGTFSHRHAIVNDSQTGEPYNSLNFIAEKQEKFEIYNSLLSEFGVLGFEFGYSMANPNALVLWEAQFGDFANGAQVMIDQFISCCESKWQRMSGLVMLLPHGYEGQGPEHSNARPERFLQLCAEYNMVVANITTPANYFHLLRRQMAWPFRKPCVVMSPKSLLRHSLVVSPIEDFVSGSFKEIIADDFAEVKSVKKVLLCSGKIYYDLLEKQQADNRKDVAIVRIEQLHPFPTKQTHELLSKYKNPKVVWIQEEPENMGAWTYVLRQYQYVKLEVICRKASASPATGYNKVHLKEQEKLIKKAFS